MLSPTERPLNAIAALSPMTMGFRVAVPNDKEFQKNLRDVLAKPDEWYDERVDRAVRDAKRVKRRAGRVSRKG